VDLILQHRRAAVCTGEDNVALLRRLPRSESLITNCHLAWVRSRAGGAAWKHRDLVIPYKG
jgi:hypothetical protein